MYSLLFSFNSFWTPFNTSIGISLERRFVFIECNHIDPVSHDMNNSPIIYSIGQIKSIEWNFKFNSLFIAVLLIIYASHSPAPHTHTHVLDIHTQRRTQFEFCPTIDFIHVYAIRIVLCSFLHRDAFHCKVRNLMRLHIAISTIFQLLKSKVCLSICLCVFVCDCCIIEIIFLKYHLLYQIGMFHVRRQMSKKCEKKMIGGKMLS